MEAFAASLACSRVADTNLNRANVGEQHMQVRMEAPVKLQANVHLPRGTCRLITDAHPDRWACRLMLTSSTRTFK